MRYNLEQIWSFDYNTVKQVLTSQKLKVTFNPAQDYIQMALLYDQHNLLTPNASQLIHDSQYQSKILDSSITRTVLPRIPNRNRAQSPSAFHGNKIVNPNNYPLYKYFLTVADLYEGNDLGRAIAFRRVMKVIGDEPKTITSSNDLAHHKYVGPDTKADIDEFLKYGSTKRLQSLQKY